MMATPSKEKKMFTRYYSVFCDIIKHEDLLPKFVEQNIITADQLKEICAASSSDKGPNFLVHISKALDGDNTEGFITMLKVMKEHGTPDTQKFIVDVEVEMKDIDDDDESPDKYAYNARAGEDPFYSDDDLDERFKHAAMSTAPVLYNRLTPEQEKIRQSVQVMLVVVNEREFKACMSYLRPPTDKDKTFMEIHRQITSGHDIKTAIFHVGLYGKCLVAVMRVEAGHGGLAVEQTDYFPNCVLVCAVGVTAGFPENGCRMADILVSERVTDCSIMKEQDGRYIPRGETFSGSEYMIQCLKNYGGWDFQCSKAAENNKADVEFGLYLSRPVLLDDPKERKKILRFFGKEADGYEMEGFELFGKVEAIVVKSVCDLAGEKTKKWQATSALAANDYLHYHLSRINMDLVEVQKVREEPDGGLTHYYPVPQQPNNQFSPAVYALLAVIIVMLAIIIALLLRG